MKIWLKYSPDDKVKEKKRAKEVKKLDVKP
jgi:hypothetical protein